MNWKSGCLVVVLTLGMMVPLAAARPKPATKAEYEQFALTHPGDRRKGEQLFRDREKTLCVTCHRVNGNGGEVGPDLSQIGGKFDRPHLIESLLQPSAQIVEGYRSETLRLIDGRVKSGIVRKHSNKAILLFDEKGEAEKIALTDIEEREGNDQSLMPENLEESLTREEFTDLIAYLETLRSGVKMSPGAKVIGPLRVPRGFEVQPIVKGLTGATALETLADGRVLVCEQPGSLRVVKNGQLREEPLLRVDVENYWERGLIGVTVDPDFPKRPYVYVCYVAKEPYPHHHISRFTVSGDRADPASELILLKGDDQRKLGGKVPAGHQGGALHFGPDGKLYVGIGEQTAETPAQELTTFQGKILRINPDGSIPPDNPFIKQTQGKYRAIWARGCRNPFTFAFRKSDGLMFINDVGGKYEEINPGQAGANYGWPVVEHGPTQDERFVGPIHYYPQASINGGDFAPPDLAWPKRYRGHYFFADFVHGWIKHFHPDRPKDVKTFLTGLRRPVDLRFGEDGGLYVLLRNAWVVDGKFQEATGSLLRIRYIGKE